MKIGFGVADITPAPGTGPTGSFRPRVMSGVHDPLLASACVLEDGARTAALIGVDAGVVMRETADTARDEIAARTGIARDNILIGASHTHQGGPTLSLFHAVADPAYRGIIARGVADAAAQAWKRRAEAQIASGFGRVSGIHFNRRFLMRSGRQATHPGKLNPQIVCPAGPVDEKLGVLAVRGAEGRLAGVVVNFACHCTVTEQGTEYSADYVHYLRAHLKRLLGPEVAVVFLLGACGDVTQVDNQQPGAESGHAWADAMGATLAGEAARVIERMVYEDQPVLAAASVTARIAVREGDLCPPPEVGLGCGDEWERLYEAEAAHVAALRVARPVVDCAIHGMRIGELGIVSSGAELFCRPALDIQQAAPRAKTWVTTLVNEYIGYVPTADAHAAGGYEVRTARSSFLEAAAAQKLVEASLEVQRKVEGAN
jgi:hypothetical protein